MLCLGVIGCLINLFIRPPPLSILYPHPSVFLSSPSTCLFQGAEAREGACRALARPGGAPGAPDADAHRGCQEPAQPPGARRERGPSEPFVPADGSLRPARAQTQRGLLWCWGERHLGAARQQLDNTGVRGQGEEMKLMVKVLGDRERYKNKSTVLSILYHRGGSVFF